MRPWRYVGANPQSWWCVQPLCTSDFSNPVTTATREMQSAKALGAQNVRLEIPWPLIETSSGVYDWSRADAILHAASQVGITIEPILMWTPQWAGGGSLLSDPPSAADMQAFAQAFARRYDPVIKRGVEVWNEEDGGKYFAGSASDYVSHILNPAYTGIKAVDPSIPVILGGTASDPNGSYLQAVMAAGGHFDIAAFHNYVGSALSEAQTYRSVLTGDGRASTPVWLGEYGAENGTASQTSLIQQVLGQSSPLAMAQWYNLRDTDSWSCTSTACSDVAPGTWGLLSSGFSAKSSYTTMQGYLSGRTTSAPPAWSPPTSAPSSTAPPPPATAGPSSSTTATPAPSPSSTPDSSPSPTAATSTATSPSPSAGLSVGDAAALGRGKGGVPWALLGGLLGVLLLAGGAALWFLPPTHRMIAGRRP